MYYNYNKFKYQYGGRADFLYDAYSKLAQSGLIGNMRFEDFSQLPPDKQEELITRLSTSNLNQYRYGGRYKAQVGTQFLNQPQQAVQGSTQQNQGNVAGNLMSWGSNAQLKSGLAGLGAAGAQMLGSTIAGDAKADTARAFTGNIVGGIGSGAAAGAAFGPIGMGVGAALGAIKGTVDSIHAKNLYREGLEEDKKATKIGELKSSYNPQLSSLRYGGRTNYQKSGTIYVDNPNDPRYKAYSDSLYSYNKGYQLAGDLGKIFDDEYEDSDYKGDFQKLYNRINKGTKINKGEGFIGKIDERAWSDKELLDYVNSKGLDERLRPIMREHLNMPVKHSSSTVFAELPPIFRYDKPVQPVMSTSTIYGYMDKKGMNPSLSNRQKLATQYGIKNYTGTPEQNEQLRQYLIKNESNSSQDEADYPYPNTSNEQQLFRYGGEAAENAYAKSRANLEPHQYSFTAKGINVDSQGIKRAGYQVGGNLEMREYPTYSGTPRQYKFINEYKHGGEFEPKYELEDGGEANVEVESGEAIMADPRGLTLHGGAWSENESPVGMMVKGAEHGEKNKAGTEGIPVSFNDPESNPNGAFVYSKYLTPDGRLAKGKGDTPRDSVAGKVKPLLKYAEKLSKEKMNDKYYNNPVAMQAIQEEMQYQKDRSREGKFMHGLNKLLNKKQRNFNEIMDYISQSNPNNEAQTIEGVGGVNQMKALAGNPNIPGGNPEMQAQNDPNAQMLEQVKGDALASTQGNEQLNPQEAMMKKGGWIQKATESIKRRGTEGVCTGSKFGGPTCPAGSKRYNLAKTFRKMAKSRQEGGYIDEYYDDDFNEMEDEYIYRNGGYAEPEYYGYKPTGGVEPEGYYVGGYVDKMVYQEGGDFRKAVRTAEDKSPENMKIIRGIQKYTETPDYKFSSFNLNPDKLDSLLYEQNFKEYNQGLNKDNQYQYDLFHGDIPASTEAGYKHIFDTRNAQDDGFNKYKKLEYLKKNQKDLNLDVNRTYKEDGGHIGYKPTSGNPEGYYIGGYEDRMAYGYGGKYLEEGGHIGYKPESYNVTPEGYYIGGYIDKMAYQQGGAMIPTYQDGWRKRNYSQPVDQDYYGESSHITANTTTPYLYGGMINTKTSPFWVDYRKEAQEGMQMEAPQQGAPQPQGDPMLAQARQAMLQGQGHPAGPVADPMMEDQLMQQGMEADPNAPMADQMQPQQGNPIQMIAQALPDWFKSENSAGGLGIFTQPAVAELRKAGFNDREIATFSPEQATPDNPITQFLMEEAQGMSEMQEQKQPQAEAMEQMRRGGSMKYLRKGEYIKFKMGGQTYEGEVLYFDPRSGNFQLK